MKILITGPITGYNKGREKSQAEFLIKLLEDNGINVVWASKFPKRIVRGIDIVRTILKNRDTDIAIVMVYSYGAFFYADIASYLLKNAGIPVIFWLHGGSLPEFTEKHRKWVFRVLKRGKTLVAPSEYLAGYYRSLGLDVHIIRNIIFSENYPFHKDNELKPRLLWMRTFHPIYNPYMAIYAFKETLSEIPDATLTMAGVDKGLLKDTIKLAEDLGVSANVNFAGFLDGIGKIEAMKTHYIYLHTNNIDNTPVSVIEALMSGLIVIGTNAGGMPYLLKHEENAFLVNPGDYSKMAHYIIKLFKDRTDIEKIKKNGRKLAMEFDSKNVIKEWISLLNNIQKEKRYV